MAKHRLGSDRPRSGGRAAHRRRSGRSPGVSRPGSGGRSCRNPPLPGTRTRRSQEPALSGPTRRCQPRPTPPRRGSPFMPGRRRGAGPAPQPPSGPRGARGARGESRRGGRQHAPDTLSRSGCPPARPPRGAGAGGAAKASAPRGPDLELRAALPAPPPRAPTPWPPAARAQVRRGRGGPGSRVARGDQQQGAPARPRRAGRPLPERHGTPGNSPARTSAASEPPPPPVLSPAAAALLHPQAPPRSPIYKLRARSWGREMRLSLPCAAPPARPTPPRLGSPAPPPPRARPASPRLPSSPSACSSRRHRGALPPSLPPGPARAPDAGERALGRKGAPPPPGSRPRPSPRGA
ncbi:basic proline-rich protein-like [Myotis yumanensis]|uniref:basic proline-rich protein-like n=1 Tax=Myotis yumanensis TaxID=159337 RepID=UPI0038D21929